MCVRVRVRLCAMETRYPIGIMMMRKRLGKKCRCVSDVNGCRNGSHKYGYTYMIEGHTLGGFCVCVCVSCQCGSNLKILRNSLRIFSLSLSLFLLLLFLFAWPRVLCTISLVVLLPLRSSFHLGINALNMCRAGAVEVCKCSVFVRNSCENLRL